MVITIITSFSQNARIFMFDSSKNPQKNTDYRKNNAGAVRQKLWVLASNNCYCHCSYESSYLGLALTIFVTQQQPKHLEPQKNAESKYVWILTV